MKINKLINGLTVYFFFFTMFFITNPSTCADYTPPNREEKGVNFTGEPYIRKPWTKQLHLPTNIIKILVSPENKNTNKSGN